MDRSSELKFISIHPMEEPNVEELNQNSKMVKDALVDIDNKLIVAGEKYEHMILNSKLKIKNIREMLLSEKERLEDLNFLANKFDEFSKAIPLEKEDFNGDLTIENGIIKPQITSYKKIGISISNVEGNGYEGNSYVLIDDEFASETLKTNDKKNITDSNITTSYEYSRLTVSSNAEALPALFNYDSIDVECSIDIKAQEEINEIYINSERNDLILRAVYISNDGLMYELDKEYELEINNKNEKYNTQEYVFGSGLVSIPPSKYIKVVLKSNGYSSDVIAYKKIFNNETLERNLEKTEIVKDAKRHLIKINEIAGYKNLYAKGSFVSRELITDSISRISVFCNEYTQSKYSIDNTIKYFLIVNGIEHSIVPINSHREGKKIIRTSSHNYEASSTTYLNEEIKSAKLKIVMNPATEEGAAYISNLKILIGKKE